MERTWVDDPQNPNVIVHEMKRTEGGKDSGRSPRVELRGRG